MENLAIASVLGFLAFIVGMIAFAVDSSSVAMQRNAFSETGATVAVAERADDPAFDCVFSVQKDSGLSYGIVLSLRSPERSALVGASFSINGDVLGLRLLGLRLLGSSASRLAPGAQDLVDQFPGADETLARASETVRELAKNSSGAKT
jgi:hypothetical protein